MSRSPGCQQRCFLLPTALRFHSQCDNAAHLTKQHPRTRSMEIARRIDLVRYTCFCEDLLALDLVVSVAEALPRSRDSSSMPAESRSRTQAGVLAQAPAPLGALMGDLDARLLELGDSSTVRLAQYVAYRRSRNFACVKVLLREECLVVYLRVDPATVELEDGFTRDVSVVGHHGTGDLEVRIRTAQDLDRAATLFAASFQAA